MKSINKEDYVRALERMKRSRRDRIGILGELGVTGLGTAAGVAMSGMLAAIAGASTLAGSTTLASIAGGLFVTATPVGWVVGSAMAGGALAYGAGRLIRSGTKCDFLKESKSQELEERIKKLEKEARDVSDSEKKIPKLITMVQYLVWHEAINQNKATEIIGRIEKNTNTIDQEFKSIRTHYPLNHLTEAASKNTAHGAVSGKNKV